MCPATRASRYDTDGWDEYTRWSRENVMVIPIIESIAGVEDAEGICAADGVEVIMFGPGDLGMELGVGGQGLEDQAVQDSFERVKTAARKTGVAIMSTPFPDSSLESARQLIENGVDVLLQSVDELLFFKMCKELSDSLEPVRDRLGLLNK